MPATTFSVSRTNPRFSFIAEAELAELVDGPRIVAPHLRVKLARLFM